MSQFGYNKDIINYNAGAVTALSYAAELGVSKDIIFEILNALDLTLEDIDESDKERFIEAFGDLSLPLK